MKKLIFASLVLLAATSCTKHEDAPATPSAPPAVAAPAADAAAPTATPMAADSAAAVASPSPEASPTPTPVK